MKLQLSLRDNKQVNNESAAANDSKHVIKQRMSIMTNEHTHMLAYWFLSYIGRKSSSSSSAVNSRISRGGSGGGLKHMLTVHPLMFRVGAVCGGLRDTAISYCF